MLIVIPLMYDSGTPIIHILGIKIMGKVKYISEKYEKHIVINIMNLPFGQY